MADPLEEPRPRFDLDAVARAVEDRYGLRGDLVALHGERDLNYELVCRDHQRYLVKIYNPAEPASAVAMRLGALEHISRVDPDLVIPHVLPSLDEALTASATAIDGRVSAVQVLTFLEGHHAKRDELDHEALVAWGAMTARLGRALRGYFHPAARYPIQWDIAKTAELEDRLALLGPGEVALVAPVLKRFSHRVAPRLDGLRAQVIHNDMSRQNVLVDDAGHIVGITDFGDMTHTALVFDLAVAVADVLDGRPGSLDLAEQMIAGYCSVTPLEPGEAELLGDLVAARLATAVVVSTWRRANHSDAPDFVEGAVAFLALIDGEGHEAVSSRFEAAARRASPLPATAPPYHLVASGELAVRRRHLLGPLKLSYDNPLHLSRGEGVHLFDRDGRRYLDCYNNVPVVGHAHPAVAAAIAAQARLLVTNTRYLHEAPVELADRLLDRAPAGLDRVLFVNSGSEANDLAWRIATHATAARAALVTKHAYHGITEATAALSPEEWPAGYVAPAVGLLAPPVSSEGPSPGARSAAAEVIDELAAAGHQPAALFIDSLYTSDGILGPAREWLAATVAAVRAAGGRFVADEVQAGFGRTGEHLWGIASCAVAPDLMTLGKPMGNGVPVAAVLGRADLVDPFVEATGYFSTFGGNTLAAAAALAVLDVIADEALVERAARVGSHLGAQLLDVIARHEELGSMRRWGLVCGIEVVDAAGGPDAPRANVIVNRLRELGALIGTTGPADNVLKIRPPLVFCDRDADHLAELLDAALGS